MPDRSYPFIPDGLSKMQSRARKWPNKHSNRSCYLYGQTMVCVTVKASDCELWVTQTSWVGGSTWSTITGGQSGLLLGRPVHSSLQQKPFTKSWQTPLCWKVLYNSLSWSKIGLVLSSRSIYLPYLHRNYYQHLIILEYLCLGMVMLYL